MGGRIGGASVGDASFADHKSCRRAGLRFAGWRSRSVALAERSQPSLSANPAVATGDLIKSSSQLRCNCTAWVLAGADRQDRRRRSRDLHASVAVIRRARPRRCPAVAQQLPSCAMPRRVSSFVNCWNRMRRQHLRPRPWDVAVTLNVE